MIKIENLNFGYRKKEVLFNQFNLALSPGNIYGLLGKNGAGKTTLLKLISGLLYPQTGVCTYNQILTFKRTPEFLSEIFFLPEISYLPAIKVKEYLEIYSLFYPRFDENKFYSHLKDFEIESGKRLTSYSYGQKKKFSLAFALAANTKIILLDEPTNGLDIPAKSVFRKLVASSIDDEKIFVISTHQVRDMKHLIDPILILEKGEIIFNRQIAEIEQKLSLEFMHEEPKPGQVLYYENTLGGFAVLNENNNGSENEIDIELLFNAVVSDNQKIRSLFHEEVTV
jgi:ABC-2 type transport system ATP-binding protein